MGAWGDDEDGPPDADAIREATNGRAQFECAMGLLRDHLNVGSGQLVLTPDLICDLHRTGMVGIIDTAGQLRRREVEIVGSSHEPPPARDVGRLLAEACDIVNATTDRGDAVHCAAYVLWRLCWIHPFDDGNGRAARVISYLILSARLGMELPGALPVPLRMKHAPLAYLHALEAADAEWRKGRVNVGKLVQLLAWYLAAQVRDDPIGLPPDA